MVLSEVYLWQEFLLPRISIFQFRKRLPVPRKHTPAAFSPSAAPAAAPVKITGDADYDKLPSGSLFIGPDGQQRRKP